MCENIFGLSGAACLTYKFKEIVTALMPLRFL